jgi:hypothetical protein
MRLLLDAAPVGACAGKIDAVPIRKVLLHEDLCATLGNYELIRPSIHGLVGDHGEAQGADAEEDLDQSHMRASFVAS